MSLVVAMTHSRESTVVNLGFTIPLSESDLVPRLMTPTALVTQATTNCTKTRLQRFSNLEATAEFSEVNVSV